MNAKNLNKFGVGIYMSLIVFGIFLFLSACVNAYTQEGLDICTCDSCNDCNSALNDSINCSSTVKLTQSMVNFSGNCINNPKNFSNKIFDCQGHLIEGNNSGCGIYLANNRNNIIRNCIITDFEDGIYVYDYSSNNTLINNTINSSGVGIYLGDVVFPSSNNVLINNTANSNSYGIYLKGSHNNIIINNTANSNSDTGIYLYYSSNNKLINNTANSNSYGVYLGTYPSTSSNNNVLINNTANSNSHYGIYLHCSSHNTISNNILNSNSNKGIYLYMSASNNLTSNTANSNRYGIYLYSKNNTLINNTANWNNREGIFLGMYSSNNILTNNTANWNNRSGICLWWYSSNNILTSNTCNANNKFGIFLDASSNNNINLNYACENAISDINISDGNGNIGDNICDNLFDNENNGNNVTCSQSCSSSCPGTFCNGICYNETGKCCNKTWFTNVTCCFNIDCLAGYFCSNDKQCVLTPDNICNCLNCSECNGKLNNLSCSIVILTADVSNHTGTCIDDPYNFNNKIFDCQGHTIDGNDSGTDYGIYLKDKAGNIIRNCIVAGFKKGIYLKHSPNNTLINNTINSNIYGIYLFSNSNFNKILNNKILNNSEVGVAISKCIPLGGKSKLCYKGNSNNTIERNEILNNKIGIFSRGSNSIINNNTVCNNINLDFNSIDWLLSYGDNNNCSKSYGWNDAKVTGCKISCKCINFDFNNDQQVDIFDVVAILENLSEGKEIRNTGCSDVNKSNINLFDVFALIDKIITER